MAFQISDAATPMPLLRKQNNQTADDARTQTKKVIATRRDPNGPEEKSTFMIRVFSGTTNEDLVCLLVTLNQFKAWAEAKGLWQTSAAQDATELFTEWRKCLASLAEQKWNEVNARIAGQATKTFALFKRCVSEYIVKKIAHDEDAYFTQKEYMSERRIPSGMTFHEYNDQLELYGNYLPLLLDRQQMLQYQADFINSQARLQYEKEALADQLLWTVGTLTEQEQVTIILHNCPERWKTDFAMIGGNHRSSLEKVKEMMSIYDGFDRARNRNRYSFEQRSTVRGGTRRTYQQPRNNNMSNYQQQPFYRGRFQNQNQNQNYYYQNHNGQRNPTSAQRNFRSQGSGRIFGRDFRRGGQRTPNFGSRFGGNYYQNRGDGPKPDAVRSQHNFYQEEDNTYNDRQEHTNQPTVSTGIDGGEDTEEEYFMEAYEEEQELCDEFNAIMDVGYTFDDVPMERDQYVRRTRRERWEDDEYVEDECDEWGMYSQEE